LRLILREIVILRKLSQDNSNIFTSKLKQIILPEDLYAKKDVAETENNSESLLNLKALNHIFIVMDLETANLGTFIRKSVR